MTFSFDEQFTMFDVTPVENQFILEQLPGARGDYVKVYLYGLLYCYHPKKEVTPASMSRDLGITEEEIHAAFRYWERHGAVRRISDNPPEWQYVSFKQRMFMGGEPVEPEYVAFTREVQRAFGEERDFRGSEIAAAYEWKERMELPTEVILMLLRHMIRTKGKSFRISEAEKLAIRLADENARTEEEAAVVLSRDEAAVSGMRRVLRLLGKRHMPSDANVDLYRKWTREWGFTHEAIEEACGKTGTNDPNLALVDAILKKAYESSQTAASKGLKREAVRKSANRHEDIKAVMHQVGRNGNVTAYQEEIYGRMEQIYPHEIIMIAARECDRLNKKDPEYVLQLLQSWKTRGFVTQAEIEAHVRVFHDRDAFMKKIRARWTDQGVESGEFSRELLARWEEKLGLSRELILKAADMAVEARKPLAYMDTLLAGFAEKGIRTPEEAERYRPAQPEKTRAAGKPSGTKSVNAQNYSQRDYSGEDEAALERMMNNTWGLEDA